MDLTMSLWNYSVETRKAEIYGLSRVFLRKHRTKSSQGTRDSKLLEEQFYKKVH